MIDLRPLLRSASRMPVSTRGAAVETDSHRNTAYRLYETFGFEVLKGVLVYRKDYATGVG
jgi:hypothetical protein